MMGRMSITTCTPGTRQIVAIMCATNGQASHILRCMAASGLIVKGGAGFRVIIGWIDSDLNVFAAVTVDGNLYK